MSTLNLGDSLILDTDYSTSEKKTGATWIDGKPIYAKTYEIKNFVTTANTISTKTFNDVPTNVDMVIDIRGMGWFNNGSVNVLNTIPFAYINTSQSNSWFIRCCYLGTNFVVDFLTGQAAHTMNGWVTLYYTKTTD